MIKAIETVHNGYRFRSRLEARWAVFFDTLGIPYEYEKEGIDLDGTWYLPDFWLPRQKSWIEIKGEKPTAEEKEKADLLAIYSGSPVYIFDGDVVIPDRETQRGAYYCGEMNLLGICANHFDYSRRMEKIEELGLEDEDDIMAHYDTQVDCFLNAPPHLLALFRKLENHDHSGLMVISYYQKPVLRVIAPLSISQQMLYQIKKHEQDLIKLLSYHQDWIWTLDDFRYSYPCYWCECPFCGEFGITDWGRTSGLPCKCFETRDINPSDNYKTPRLIAAYTAARQARFEQR